jgi:hypothetical protein
MKHVIIHFISFLLGVAFAAAGFTYAFPQIDPQQEKAEQSQPPPSKKGQPPSSGNQKQKSPNFTPQDMPPPNSKGAPPPRK